MIIDFLTNITAESQIQYKNTAKSFNIKCINYYEWLNDIEKIKNIEIENKLMNYITSVSCCIKDIEEAKKTLLFITNDINILKFYYYIMQKIKTNVKTLEHLLNMEYIPLCA